jgi:ATP/maltotriose-dependent transcriptional regulator MalT
MSTHTHLRPRGCAGGISLAALLALLPAAVAAQSTNGAAAPDLARADAMHKEADALIQDQDTKNWKEAARLYEVAAKLRGAEDPASIGERVLAGELQHYLGSLSRAQDNLETAAEGALRYGRVLESAKLYLNAAFIAQERGQAADVATLVRNAERLARSPHLSQDECDCILTRFFHVTASNKGTAGR